MQYMNILVPAAGAFFWTLYQFWDNYYNKGEKFSPKKYVQGAVIGGIVAIATGLTAAGVPHNTIVTALTAATGYGGSDVLHKAVTNSIGYFNQYEKQSGDSSSSSSGN